MDSAVGRSYHEILQADYVATHLTLAKSLRQLPLSKSRVLPEYTARGDKAVVPESRYFATRHDEMASLISLITEAGSAQSPGGVVAHHTTLSRS